MDELFRSLLSVTYGAEDLSDTRNLRVDPTKSATTSLESTSDCINTKTAVVQALAAARRKQLVTEELALPSLQEESRNDQERQSFDSMVVKECSDGGELEVTLKPAFQTDDLMNGISPQNSAIQYFEERSNENSPEKTTNLTTEELEHITNQIILEAKLETMKIKSLGYSTTCDDPVRRRIVQDALERLGSQHKGGAQETLLEYSAMNKGEEGTFPTQTSLTGFDSQFSDCLLTPEPAKDTVTALRSPGASGTPPPSAKPPRFPKSAEWRPPPSPRTATNSSKLQIQLSPASSIGSIEDYDRAVSRLITRLKESDELPHETLLRQIDGVDPIPMPQPSMSMSMASQQTEEETFILPESDVSPPRDATLNKIKKVKTVVIKSLDNEQEKPEEPSYGGWFHYFWGGGSSQEVSIKDEDSGDSMAPIACGPHRVPQQRSELPAMATSLVRVASDPLEPSYAEAINAQNLIDPRMPEWVDNQFTIREELPKDGTYRLGDSRTVIVHEILRGSWTWCTAWSPDGNRLAIATENHHLAVVDTSSSSVWRVRHDKRVTGPAKGDTTHSIRCIAWGNQFIAIGGVGNAVSILAPSDPYPIVHTITATGFVGSMDWLNGSNTLLIGSRLGKAMIVKVSAQDKDAAISVDPHHKGAIESTIVHTVDRQRAWVNAVKFSPGGSAFAVGDSKGILGVYSYEEKTGFPVVSNIANFKLEDSILDVEWSPDGQWLYAGGEDFVVTVISSQWWEAVHRIKRDRWVQFISSSRGGSHVAIGGVSAEVSILDVDRGWDTAINVSLKGLVPLSAEWHPKDQYLVLTGQNNSILAVETTSARYVTGHFLRSVSPVFAIEFSPDGRMAAIGNEAGVVTIFKLSETTFTTTYELVLDCNGSLSITWSLNGAYLAVATGNKVVVIARSTSLPETAPPNASGFYVAKVIRDVGAMHDVAIDPQSRFLAVSGTKTRVYDATANFKCVFELESGGILFANSWSPDGTWFATIGNSQNLLIYDTKPESSTKWRVVFTVKLKQPGLALAWGPAMLGGLQYCAYGGEDKKVYIMEIRTKERTWETVLSIPRDGVIHDLDWNSEGLLAAAVGNGTVTVMDLSYLQSGWAVNEMDYNWQRQALTCFTEIRRNKGKNCMKAVRWIPSAPGSDSLLAVGGTDGEVEIVDLTERERCSGFNKVAAYI